MPECLILTSSNIWNVDKISHTIVIYLPHQISQLKYRHQNLVHLYFPSFEKKNSNFNLIIIFVHSFLPQKYFYYEYCRIIYSLIFLQTALVTWCL